LQSRSYENNEQQRVYVTEVVVETFQFLESKTANEQRQNNQNNQQNDNSDSNFEGAAIDISDDDLPF
ncbi:single-strand DNA-binding protein, partial [Enterococcus pernyi]